MDYVYVGKIVNTHGIKGELRILSNFEFKERVFKPMMALYVGKSKTKEIIASDRHHKNYDMVIFQGINNINEVLHYKNESVYVNKADLQLTNEEYLYEDLIDLSIKFNKETLGKVIDVMYNNGNVLLKVQGLKDFYIPLQKHFIKNIDLTNKYILVENVEGLVL